MKAFPIRTLNESDLDSIVETAGGTRAHADADRRDEVGADYVIGNHVIELKLLDEEGFGKPERQRKLAQLFGTHQLGRPVIVLDPQLLPDPEQRRYRNVIEQPVKRVIAKARQQLLQTRSEFPGATGSVLWIFNNGYTALDHETLEALVVNRVRQDTSAIDGVIVSGCYYHSDGFEGVVLWPCSYVPIRTDRDFPEFAALQAAFHAFAERFMTALMHQTEPSGDKFEVRDLVFDVDGIRCVRPAPVMGQASEFYIKGRPRASGSTTDDFGPVGLIVPGLTRADHALIAGVIGEPGGPLGNWEAWQRHLAGARAASGPTKPLVIIPTDGEAWLSWCREEALQPSLTALNRFAHDLFDTWMLKILKDARERADDGIVPGDCVLVITQEIGQDRANDVSDIAVVREHPTEEAIVRPLVENLRIHHEHAVALAAAYALAEGLDEVRWHRDRRHGWV